MTWSYASSPWVNRARLVDFGDSNEREKPRAEDWWVSQTGLLQCDKAINSHSRSPQNLEYFVFSAESSSTTSKRLPVELNAWTTASKANRRKEIAALMFNFGE